MKTVKLIAIALVLLSILSIESKAQYQKHNLIRQMFDGTEWLNDTKYEYQYTKDNKKISEKEYLWRSGKWSLYTGFDYTYKNELQIEEIFSGIKYNDYVQKQKTVYSYDDHNNQILKREYTIGSKGWTMAYKYRMYYNAAGKQTKRVMHEQYGDTMIMNFKTMYFFDDDNREIKMEYYSLLDTVPHILERYLTEFNGKTSITISKSKENYGWRKRNKVIKIYNDKDSIISETTLAWSITDWVQTLKEEFEYDGLGNITKHKKYQFDFDKWTPKERETFKFRGKQLIYQLDEKMYSGNWIEEYRTLEAHKVK